MSTGSVSIAVDGTVTKSGVAGTIYDATVAVLAAKTPAVTIPSGPDGVPMKQGIADVCNSVAPGCTGAGLPVGTLAFWGLNTDPSDTDYRVADGRAISRTTFAALFALWGTTYGAGDGSTTFNIPDLRGRVVVGGNNASLPNGASGSYSTRALAATGGAETHTLITAELPAHSHTLTDPGHYHSPQTGTNFLTTGGTGESTTGGDGGSSLATSTDTTGITVNNTGSDTAHNNMQPFLVLNMIVKVL